MIVHREAPHFNDRSDAGRQLGEKLADIKSGNEVVFAVPRGGIPVAIEVALRLKAALDVIIPRKITIPFNPEAGYGAVTEDGSIVLNESLVQQLSLPQQEIERQAERVRSEIIRRADFFRGRIQPSSVEGKTAVLVDDGLASGFTMLAAVKSVHKRGAARTIVAVPVASSRAYDLVKPRVDELVCLVIAQTLRFAVASFYSHWYDLTDDDVDRFLEDWRRRRLEGK